MNPMPDNNEVTPVSNAVTSPSHTKLIIIVIFSLAFALLGTLAWYEYQANRVVEVAEPTPAPVDQEVELSYEENLELFRGMTFPGEDPSVDEGEVVESTGINLMTFPGEDEDEEADIGSQ